MEVKNIEFSDNFPEKVTIEMTVDEAAYLTALTGKLSQVTANEIVQGAYFATSEFYGLLTTLVFNAYFEDGIFEYMRRLNG